MSFDLPTWLNDVRSELDTYMQPLFEDAWPVSFAQPCRYPLFGGGKRLRPALCMAAFESLGHTKRERALAPAAALELIHTYSLVHDDLPAMDDDDERRGRPTVHKAFDEPLAILAGDALLTEAFYLLATAPLAPLDRLQLIERLSTASGYRGMVGGQAGDIAGQPDSLLTLERVHERKTGALLQASAAFGAIAGGATAEQLEAIEAFGANLGMAFQLADDVLDYEEDQGPDGPPSYATFLGVEQTRERAQTLIDQAIERVHILPQPAALIALGHYFIHRTV